MTAHAPANLVALRNDPLGIEAGSDGEVWTHLGEVAVPTVVLCGDLDLPHIVLRSEELAGRLAHGRFETVAGTAHLPQLEVPAVVAGRILEVVS